jgi:citrate lyase subunit beta / citryl-CoA lyase
VGAMTGPTARHADIAREVGFTWTPEGVETLYLRSRALIACRAYGVHPLTGLWEDVHDLDGLRRFAQDGQRLGFRGQIVIHPSHVPVVNEAFTPTAQDVAFYRGMVAAFEQAEANGKGALVYEGRHIDIAHVETARQWLDVARALGVPTD